MKDAKMTKPEMEVYIARLEVLLKEKDEEIAKLRVSLFGTSSDGYLVEAPNKGYFGETLGIRFTAGIAFVPEGMPNAREILQQLVDDFNYSCKPIKAADYAEIIKKPKTEKPRFIDQITEAEGVKANA